MCSRNEFETRLDKIPPEYPYEVVANLREIHRLLHQGVAVSSVSAEGVHADTDELVHTLTNLKPTDLKKALDLVAATIKITEDNFLKPGNTVAKGILTQLNSQHVPLDKIEHTF